MLLVVLQYALWAGRNSLPDYIELEGQLRSLSEENEALRARNDHLHAEVVDIKTRLDAIEAQARSELGMIKEGETYYQIVDPEQ